MTVRARGKENSELTDAKETRGTRHGHSEACVWGMCSLSGGKRPMGNGHSGWEVRREMWGAGVMETRTETTRWW